jgi:hypothetical protein
MAFRLKNPSITLDPAYSSAILLSELDELAGLAEWQSKATR